MDNVVAQRRPRPGPGSGRERNHPERRVEEPEERSGRSGETARQRVDRELDQLLQELRVALPGVQVLLAFLLTVPFSTGFARLDTDAERAYVASISLAALAMVLLIAPTVHHRMRFRGGAKEAIILASNWLALVGIAFLGAAVGCGLYVVGDFAFPETPLRWLGPVLTAVAAVVWFIVPLLYSDDQARSSGAHRSGAQ